MTNHAPISGKEERQSELGAPRPANFDRIARPYRWLEYAALGPMLERTRTHFLHHLRTQPLTHALALGDGDGRFLARLLNGLPELEADAVDSSAEMLRLLRLRCGTAGARLRTHQQDLLTYSPESGRVPDLITAHFIFDCFEQSQLDVLIGRLAAVAPGAVWLVSDFRIPAGALRLPAKLYVGMLYLAFRIITGLRTERLPDHAASFAAAGLRVIATRHLLFGLLTTELWQQQDVVATTRCRGGRQPGIGQIHPLTMATDPIFPDPTPPMPPTSPDAYPDPEPDPQLPDPDPDPLDPADAPDVLPGLQPGYAM